MTHLRPATALRNHCPHSRRSLCETPLDCLADGFVIIACAAGDKIVCAIKEGIIAYRVRVNCTQRDCDFSGSDLSEGGRGLFHPLWKVAIEERVDPLHVAENLCFRYQEYEALVSV